MSVSIEDRTRAVNGQFATELRTESTGLQDGGMSNSASFCFPHRLDTAEELVEFYRNVEIPGIVLSNAEFAYEDFRRQQVEEKIDAWAERWSISQDFRDWKREQIAEGVDEGRFQTRANLKVESQKAVFEDEHPMVLPALEVETITRYAQLYSRSAYLPAEELAKVDAHL